jgi:hypothetical protein
VATNCRLWPTPISPGCCAPWNPAKVILLLESILKMPKRLFLKIQLTRAEDAELKRKYDRGAAGKMAKQFLFHIPVDLPRNRAAVKSRRERNAHLAHIGNNINQIARQVNRAVIEGRFEAEMGERLEALLFGIFLEITPDKNDNQDLRA